MSSAAFVGLPDHTRADRAWDAAERAPASAVLNAVLEVLVPGDWYLRAITIALNYTSSAVVARRIPTLQLQDADGGIEFQIPAVVGQDASVNDSYYWFPGMSSTVGLVNAVQAGPWPDLIIPSGWRIRAFAQSAQAGDVIGPLTVFGTHIPTGPAALGEALRAHPAII